MRKHNGFAAGLFAVLVGFGTLAVSQSDSNGFDTRSYYYDDGKEVTVFDAQFVPPLPFPPMPRHTDRFQRVRLSASET